MAFYGEKKARVYCHHCGGRVKKLNYRGQILRSNHCGRCFCKHIENGKTCRWPRINPVIPWCSEHLRCQAAGTDGCPCNRAVKGNNPERFRFCADIHNCAHPDCTSARLSEGVYCSEHLCSHPGCAQPREGSPYPFCFKHTCQDPRCTSLTAGDAGPGSSARFCHSHRPCSRHGCSRRCYTRGDGTAAAFCSEHCCRWAEGCDDERAAGAEGHCAAHRCQEAGCPKGIAASEGHYCAGHECPSEGCRFPRLVGGHCYKHTCQRRECRREARPGGLCEHHQHCQIPGCKDDMPAEGRRKHGKWGWLPDEHQSCRFGGLRPCANRAVDDARYCEDHLCGFRLCCRPKLPGFSYCEAHKCPVPRCQELRQARVDTRPYGSGRGRATVMPGALGCRQPLMSGFCAHHGCRHEDCDGQALRGHLYCAAHKCSDADCPSEGVIPPGEEMAACDAHYGDLEDRAMGGDEHRSHGDSSSSSSRFRFSPSPPMSPFAFRRPRSMHERRDFPDTFGDPLEAPSDFLL